MVKPQKIRGFITAIFHYNLISWHCITSSKCDIIKNDNGKVVLNTSLFIDIPNLALVDLILLRGNVKIEEIDGETYKFYAETHQRLPIILVKDLSTVQREE